MKEIYADCASTTPISEPALRVMTECMRTCYGNPSSSHHCGREAARVLEEARDGIAACIEPTGKKSILHREEPRRIIRRSLQQQRMGKQWENTI